MLLTTEHDNSCEDDEELARAIQLSFETCSGSDPQDDERSSTNHNQNANPSGRTTQSQPYTRKRLTDGELHRYVQLVENGLTEDPELIAAVGWQLKERSEEAGCTDVIDKAIAFLGLATSLMDDDHIDKHMHLNELSKAFVVRFETLGECDDFDSAIRVQEEALATVPRDHGNRAHLLVRLIGLLSDRIDWRGDMKDLNDIILAERQIIPLLPDSHSEKPKLLYNLGGALFKRYEKLGKVEDLNNAIASREEAVSTNSRGSQWNMANLELLSGLAGLYALRFKNSTNPDCGDMDHAISLQRRALALTPKDGPDKALTLGDLGTMYSDRFDSFGRLSDLNNGIYFQRQSVELLPDHHPSKPACLNNFGNSLRTRFQRFGDHSDIDDAIKIQTQAVSLTHDTSRDDLSTRLYTLSTFLICRFDRVGDPEDWEKGVAYGNRVILLDPQDKFLMASTFDCLGLAFFLKFKRSSDLSNLDVSISHHQRAVELTPNGHYIFANNLANSMRKRFEMSHNLYDIDGAIHNFHRALSLLPEGHAFQSKCLHNLASAQDERAHHSKDPIVDFNRSIHLFHKAAISSTGEPLVRLHSARLWAQRMAIRDGLYKNPSAGLEGYELMMSLLPQAIWLGRTVDQRYKDIEDLGTAVNDAVAVACLAKRYDLAVEWMEQGRSLVWTQILHLRTPVDQLEEVEPKLAAEIRQVSQDLERASSSQDAVGSSGSKLLLEQATQTQQALATRWDELVRRAQSISGFEDFLQPKKISKLRQAARNEAVILVNVYTARHSCCALVIRPDTFEIDYVDLPSVSHEKVESARKTLINALKMAGIRQRVSRPVWDDDDDECKDASGPFESVLGMLWSDVAEPILSHIGYDVPQPNGELPHVTWCLTGPLAFLPIHAAGCYDGIDSQSRVFNYVVSSYTPNLSALLQPPADSSDFSVLAVSQANTRGQAALPGTLTEIAHIQCQIPESHRFTHLDGENATVSRVLSAMENHDCVHMACHALQDTSDPTSSAFLLYDEHLKLGKIMMKRLRRKKLAFLSACQTATGSEALPEEAVHLAAGMLNAGYGAVIATMWSIMDRDAPHVAEMFYLNLLSNPETKTRDALHWAVSSLREEIGEREFMSWVPFIHIG